MGKILRLSVTILSLIVITSCIAGTGSLPDSLYTSSIYPGTSNESDLGEYANYWNDIYVFNVHAANIYTNTINGSANWTGEKGDTGDQGDKGDKGDTGAAGPNLISGTTVSSLTGILKGDGGVVAVASNITDYQMPLGQGARVIRNSNVSVGNGVWVEIQYDQETFDTDNIHSTTGNSSRLTCRTAGYYFIESQIAWSANGTGKRDMVIGYNDILNIARSMVYPVTNASGYTIHEASTVYYLEVGDYVYVDMMQTNGTTLNILYLTNYSPVFLMQRIG